MGTKEILNDMLLTSVKHMMKELMMTRENILEMEGTLESLLPDGPLIISYAPHTHLIDSLITSIPFYEIAGKPPYMVKGKHIDNKYYGWFIKRNTLPIRIDSDMGRNQIEHAISQSRELLEQGISLSNFPEGTRHHENADLAAKLINLTPDHPEYASLFDKLKAGWTFLQLSYETSARVLPVKLERSGIKGLHYEFVIGEPFLNTDFRPRTEFRSEVQYWKQFKDPARQALLDIYRLSAG
jgi:1-acyl-sn-glycerol-3-phosphate acyltransferase